MGGGWVFSYINYLTIIPRAQVGSASIAHEAEGHEGDSEAMRMRGIKSFSTIQLVGHKDGDKTTLASKRRFSRHCFGFQSRHFSLLVGSNI